MRKRIVSIVLPLILGVIIYSLYHYKVLAKNNYLSSIIKNYVLDGLWVISFYFIVVCFMKKITQKYIWVTAIYTVILGALFEICQYKNIVNGTSDYLDIIVYFCASCIACLIEKKYWGNDYEKN
ncbi:MAG: hypothetical protein IKE01_05775 [Clostridia bacterium]|nr:hypothetical protein [Clostridia bacterium]